MPLKRAFNRKNEKRAVKLNSYHEPYIEKAILCFKSKNINPTYKQIQQKAFEFYKKEKENKLKKYEGIFELKFPREEALKIIEDKEIFYD